MKNKMIYNKMKQEMCLLIFCMVFGELMVLNGYIYYGLAIRLIILLFIIIINISKNLESETEIIFNSFIVLILSQIINLSMPRLFNANFMQYLLIYSVMISPTYSIIKNAGVKFRKQLYYIFAALLIGTVTTVFENKMLTTDIISINGDIVVVFLIIFLLISLLLLDTKYWHNNLDICSNSLMQIIIATGIFKIIHII